MPNAHFIITRGYISLYTIFLEISNIANIMLCETEKIFFCLRDKNEAASPELNLISSYQNDKKFQIATE